MDREYYIYRFIDDSENTIYIGRTNDIDRRIFNEHFTELGHLSDECYKAIERIEYTTVKYESEMVAYEAILININKPKYNIQFKDLAQFNIEIPELEWEELDIDEVHLYYLKSRKNKTVKLSDYFHSSELLNDDKNYIKTGLESIDCKLITRKNSLVLLSSVNREESVAYAVNQCVNVARENKKVLYISLLESSDDISEKILSHISLVPQTKLIRGELTEKNWDSISVAAKEMSELSITISNLNYQEKNIKSISKIINESSYDFIVIDSLDSLQSEAPIYNKDKTKDILERLKGLCNDIETPILLINLLPFKAIDGRVDSRPIISDLIYDSMNRFPDVIIYLYFDKRHNQICEKPNEIEIIIAKNNYGDTNISRMHYIEDLTRIFEQEKDD